jgi:hypothetical protein
MNFKFSKKETSFVGEVIQHPSEYGEGKEEIFSKKICRTFLFHVRTFKPLIKILPDVFLKYRYQLMISQKSMNIP